MPKKLEAHEAKPFQPLKTSFVQSALDDTPPEQDQGGVAVAIEPDMTTEQESVTPPAPTPRRAERKVVTIPRAPEAPSRRSRALPAPMAGERLNRPLKVQLTGSERTEITRIVNELSRTVGTTVSVSHVARALLMVFRHAEDNVLERAKQRGTMRRPPNDDLTALTVFEHELAKLLIGALRDSKPLLEREYNPS